MNPEKVKKIYDFYSDFYDFIFSWILNPNLKHILSFLEFKKGDKILEIGIGTGISIENYPTYCRITGIDISEGMLKKAKKRAERLKLNNVELKIMDATNLDFPDKSFDYVIAAFVISVCQHPEKMVDEMLRVLKDDGRIVIVNHFASENKFINSIEKLLDPLTKNIGWRMDLCLSSLLQRDGLRVERKTKLFPFSPWTGIILRKEIAAGESEH